MKKLIDIDNFGSPDADEDDLLLECFEDHEAYKGIKGHKKYLILGRKGAGKTAIFKKILSEKNYNIFSEGHSFSDYPWHHHDQQKKNGIPESECYRYSWEYVILISMAKFIVNSIDLSVLNENEFEALQDLENFLVDSYGTTSPALTKFFAPATKLKINPKMKISFPFLSGETQPEYVEISNLPKVVYEINDFISNCILKCARYDISYYVMFDELDRSFSINDEEYKKKLSSLLIATRDFNKKSKQWGKNMTSVVFLRDDIFDIISFEDKNKIYLNSSSTIEWDTKGNNNTLKNMMEKRFSKLIDFPNYDNWSAVFNEEQEMPGRQTKYQYIIDRTFKRPRDIIVYCNEILKSYKNKENKDFNKFENNDIINSRSKYSEYLKNEIEDEIHSHITNFNDYFSIIENIGYMNFSKEEFEKSYEFLKTRTNLTESSQAILKNMYDFSIISFLKVGGMSGGSTWVWKYEDTKVGFDDRSNNFKVHNGLKEVFDLKQGSANS